MDTAQLKEEELDRWRGESPAAGRVAVSEEKTNPVARTLRSVATQIKGTAEQVEGDGRQVQKVKNNISSYLHNAASYVEETNPQRIKAGIENEVRRNPGRSLLLVGAAGLVLGSLLRRRSSQD